MTRRLLLGVVALVLLVSLAPALASESYVDKTPTWTGSMAGTVGRGHCTLECDHPTRGTNVRLHASGLVPNGMYTFWMVDTDGQEKPLGVKRTETKADDKGYLIYEARIPQCPLGDRVKVIGRYENHGHSEPALQGVIVQQ